MRTRHICLFLLLFALFVSGAMAQTIVQRSALGGHVEGLTFVDKGPLANNVVIVDAYEVKALPTRAGATWQPLFKLSTTDFPICPRGIAFDSKSKQLIFDDPQRLNQLFYYDLAGNFVKSRTFSYPAGYTPTHVEGIVYLPKTSPYPEHIAIMAVTLGYPAQNRIEIIGPGNTVVKKIIPDVPTPDEQLLTGLTYQEDTGLFVVATANDNTFWTVDFNGAVVGTYSGPDTNLEALAFLKNGNMFAMPLGGHKAYMFDSAMNRVPSGDRVYQRGVDLDPPSGLAWDSDAVQYIVAGGVRYDLNSVNAAVTSHTFLFDPATLGWDYYNGIAYVPGDRGIAIGISSLRQIGVASLSGSVLQTISTAPYMPGSHIAYVPSRDAFVTRRANQLHQWSRSGVPAITVELASVGLSTVSGITCVPSPSGDQIVIAGRDASNSAVIVVTDVNLVPIASYSTTWVPAFITYLSNGPNAGKFASVDVDRNELVIMQIP